MSAVELTEAFLAKVAGWEAMKQARHLVEGDHVLSSSWAPPLLKGIVQEGGTSYRAGLVLEDSIDLENICSCRASRQWGTICAHSVAIGLHVLRASSPATSPHQQKTDSVAPKKAIEAVPEPKASRHLLRSTHSGDSLLVHVIFPPQFLQALSKGRLMICFEAQWNKGRTPLSSVPFDKPFQVSEQDDRVLDFIENIAGEPAAMLMLRTDDFVQLLTKLGGHSRITLGKNQAIEISTEPWLPSLRAHLNESGTIQLELAPNPRPPDGVIAGPTPWIYRANRLCPVGLPEIFVQLSSGATELPRERVPEFLNRDWPALFSSGQVESNFQLNDFEFEPQEPVFTLQLRGGLAQLEAELNCHYGSRQFLAGKFSAGATLWLPDSQNPKRYGARDISAEQAALARLIRSGFTGPDAAGRHQLKGQEPVLNFFAREFHKLQHEWKVTLEERLQWTTQKNLERIEPKFQITPSGEQWFDLSVTYSSSGGESLTAAEIQQLLLSGRSSKKLNNGKIALLDTGAVEEFQEALLDIGPQQNASGYRIAGNQAGFLKATLEEQPGWRCEAPKTWKERAALQAGELTRPCPPLGPLENILRSYQKDGVSWLHFLRQNHFGGILADEMGLGKTVQALALLQSGKSPQRSSPGPSIVICPTSLVFNWVAETRRFLPEFKVLALHGAQRQAQFSRIGESDLVVTSYALIRRDLELYRGLEFDTLILDEAQHIKNRQTQNAQAVKAIRSRHRLVLTGTPLENSVLDLWSIFDFLMPGYLGAANDFRERYELPITRDRDSAAQNRLARRVRPFLLRRLKKDVAKELPEKIDQLSFCEMTDPQRSIYAQLLEAGRREVLESVGAQGLAKSRIVIFNTLLRLRQTCCDLRLLPLEKTAKGSGKFDLFQELIEEILDGGHRVLVFSQFVKMLHLIRDELEARQIDFCYLDGSTNDRGAVVDRFQKSDRIPVFLISLKAGGVGLNLTAADTVIHFDPWWNPAIEDQATGRAHRIGQNRVVTSYKLITRGTIEEKIVNLQNRKRALFAGMLGSDEELASALSWDEVQELLAE